VAASVNKPSVGMHTGEKVNILLVDDQPARLLTYESILRDLGQNLIRAQSGLEALERLMKDDFAVVLLDVSMPGMDGFETASLIHEHPRFERTPIIFVTGVHVTELDRLKGYKLGAVDYVYIPVVPEILRSKVAVLVELYCKRRELQAVNRSLAAANEQLALANTTLQAEKNRELEDLNATLKRANAELEGANRSLQIEVRERKRIEQELKQADRHKDEFLAMLAHELRNPLAPIGNAVQIMRRHPLPDPKQAWVVEIVERQLGYLTRLVDDLLDVSRITRGKINLAREPVDLAVVVARAVETAQSLIAEKNHELTVDVPSSPLTVTGDMTRLTQVLSNVLSNAAKYTDVGGRIAIGAQLLEDAVAICVRDNGVGIPPHMLGSVFDLFTQVEQGTDRTQGGLGIGLALVRRLVEMHGGTVIARSEGAGHGSEFVIRLPLAHVEPQAAASTQVPEVETPPMSIVLADDNKDALESLALLLRIQGHEVHTALDGAAALTLAATHRPQLMLLDLGMPEMDGLEVARQIRAAAWGASTILVALTGWGQDEDRRRSHAAGFDTHMVKPLDMAMLMDFVTRKLTTAQA
jgi:signal transduction histidine kinase